MENGRHKVSYTQEMKKGINFWLNLEAYSWAVIKRSKLSRSWREIVVGSIGMTLLVSVIGQRSSLSGARTVQEIVVKAGEAGDYQLARELYDDSMGELEDIVYPERKIERRIAELETALENYPSNREIYLSLGQLYGQLGQGENAERYLEKARILDPNQVTFE